MTFHSLRAWLVFVLAFLMPMQAFASAIQCHSPVSSASSAPSEAHHLTGQEHAHDVTHLAEAVVSHDVNSAVDPIHAIHGDQNPEAPGQHPQNQDVCFNCAPCNASAPLVQASALQFSESRSVHAAAVPIPFYLSIPTPALERPPR
ncbi:hypothetical protein [Allohahella marinimesophila]|uniref:hypothetical protein n=1 Tax=Allohahella marinimesophila TaxID=1054972 RepID=UPI0031DD73B0